MSPTDAAHALPCRVKFLLSGSDRARDVPGPLEYRGQPCRESWCFVFHSYSIFSRKTSTSSRIWASSSGRTSCPFKRRKSLAVSSSSSMAYTAASSDAAETTGPWLASNTAPYRAARARMAAPRRGSPGRWYGTSGSLPIFITKYAEVRDQRQSPDLHHEIRCQRRQATFGRQVPHAGYGGGIGGMKMNHRASRGPLLVHGEVERSLFGWRIAGDQMAIPREFGNPRGIEPAQACVGGSEQPTVFQARADIATAASGETAIKDRAAELRDLIPHPVFRHGSRLHALRKKSSVPKFPDLRARASGLSPRLTVHGTPGSISSPMRKPSTRSMPTTAPAVSPPATISRRTA